jgi:2-C-methyl-D-erythritol 4-phosphate cytidylyltransferase/2-C-methyl-D-erythritol 2,4-cyclodiphosphate synthase
MQVTAIVAAGGRGERFGGLMPKQLLQVGGRTMLERSVALFLSHPEIAEIVVALPPDLVADPPSYLTGASKPVRLVAGGARRQDSVDNAFRASSARSTFIVVHDAARPLASAALVSRTLAAAAESGAALAALPSRDTVKQGRGGFVTATLSRESVFLAQTPQAFRRDVLDAALAQGAGEATDEASLAERAGYPVRLVEGEGTNIKITTPGDLLLAEAILMRRDGVAEGGAAGGDTGRIGTGYDLHRLVEGRPLILGGVVIPFDRGLAGHSDADAVCHAVTDAILGAAAAGDIGRHFPDTDPAWKGASSVDLLARAAALIADRGWRVGNVDVSVIAERPRLWPYLDDMRANLAAALGVGIECISIKGKTNEGVDAPGRGEAIAVHAVALVRRR